MLPQQWPVSQMLRVPQATRVAVQVTGQPGPLPLVQRHGPAWTVTFAQPDKPVLLDPARDCRRLMSEQPPHLRAGSATGDQQQDVQPMVVARLFTPVDFPGEWPAAGPLPLRLRGVALVALQLEYDHVMIRGCCMIDVVMLRWTKAI